MGDATIEKVWVLTIDHKYGTDTYVKRTEVGAKRELLSYVDRWWDEIDSTDAPAGTTEETIEFYFESREGEYYHIEEVELED